MHAVRPPAEGPRLLPHARQRGGTLPRDDPPTGDSIPRGKLQRWTLHVETTAGVPVDSGDFAVDGGMPQHGHGLPTKPRVTRALGDGDHLVEGMKFNMGGWWVVKFRLNAEAGRDSVVFNVKV